MLGSMLNPSSAGSYFEFNSIAVLVFTEETKVQSILVICLRSQDK